MTSPVGKWRVQLPSLPGTSALRDPHVAERAAHHDLVIAAAGAEGVPVDLLDALLRRYRAAGPFLGIEPAGEMWSVVTESPSTARTRAPAMSRSGPGSGGRSVKNGGSWT